MAKKKTEEVVGSVKLVCHKSKWTGYKDSCDKILSIQNCLNFFGSMTPCECFEIQELDIKDRELQKIEAMIQESEDFEVKSDLEVAIADDEEPPIKEIIKKKRRRRRKKSEVGK